MEEKIDTTFIFCNALFLQLLNQLETFDLSRYKHNTFYSNMSISFFRINVYFKNDILISPSKEFDSRTKLYINQIVFIYKIL